MGDGISDNIGFCACGPSDSDIFPVLKEEPSIHDKLEKLKLYSAEDIKFMVEHMGVVDAESNGDTVTLKIKPKHRAETIVISSTVFNGPPKTP